MEYMHDQKNYKYNDCLHVRPLYLLKMHIFYTSVNYNTHSTTRNQIAEMS